MLLRWHPQAPEAFPSPFRRFACLDLILKLYWRKNALLFTCLQLKQGEQSKQQATRNSDCLHFYTAKTQTALALPFLPCLTLRVEQCFDSGSLMGSYCHEEYSSVRINESKVIWGKQYMKVSFCCNFSMFIVSSTFGEN